MSLFFPIFHEKITTLMSIFCQKNVPSLKNTVLSYPYIIRKMSILSKTQCSHVIFFYFSKNFEKNHHTSGIELVFSFDYPSKMTKNLIVQSVQNSVYPQTPCCAFRYATISPQCYALCGPLITPLNI